jgi:ribosomal protein S18 acetylase RimI-like enzyme
MSTLNAVTSDVRVRTMTDRDVWGVLSHDWAEIADRERVASQRGGRDDASFVAEAGGGIVGFLLARILVVGRPMVTVCQLHLIAVRPDYQHRGIGSMLLDSLHEHCKTEGVPTIRALVHQDDANLLEYFENLGFHPSKKMNLDISCE